MTQFCTPRIASPGLPGNPLLNVQGGCYGSPPNSMKLNGVGSMEVSATTARMMTARPRNPYSSQQGAAVVRRSTMAALASAPVVRKAYGLGGVVDDLCNSGTYRDAQMGIAVGTAIGQTITAIGAAASGSSGNGGIQSTQDWQRAGAAVTQIGTGLSASYAALCQQLHTGGGGYAPPPAAPPAGATSLDTVYPPGYGYGGYAPQQGMSTGVKVALGVGAAVAVVGLVAFIK